MKTNMFYFRYFLNVRMFIFMILFLSCNRGPSNLYVYYLSNVFGIWSV